MDRLHATDVQDRAAYADFLKRTLADSKDATIFRRTDISIGDFEIDPKALGEGAAGRVYRARPKGGDGAWYALKRFHNQHFGATPEGNVAQNEMEKARVTQLPVAGTAALNQHFVSRLYATVKDPDNKMTGTALVYELCDSDVGHVVMEASDRGKYIPVSCTCCLFD